MNRKVLVVFVALMARLLSTSLSFASATPSTPVSGRWVGIQASLVVTNRRIAGGNVFFDVYNTGQYVGGDILGSFEQNFNVVIHYGDPEIAKSLDPSTPWLHPEAPFNWRDMERVFTGTVLGVSGGFTMRLQCTGFGNNVKGPAYYELEGTWVIISGTGGLANLHGQGTWWHTRTGFTGLEYEGQMHFDP